MHSRKFYARVHGALPFLKSYSGPGVGLTSNESGTLWIKSWEVASRGMVGVGIWSSSFSTDIELHRLQLTTADNFSVIVFFRSFFLCSILSFLLYFDLSFFRSLILCFFFYLWILRSIFLSLFLSFLLSFFRFISFFLSCVI